MLKQLPPAGLLRDVLERMTLTRTADGQGGFTEAWSSVDYTMAARFFFSEDPGEPATEAADKKLATGRAGAWLDLRTLPAGKTAPRIGDRVRDGAAQLYQVTAVRTRGTVTYLRLVESI